MSDETNMRTIQVVLDIDIRDFTEAELAECDPGFGEDYSDGLPEVDDYSPREIADLIAPALNAAETQDEMFAGSGMFIRISDVRLVSATKTDRRP